MITPVAEVLEGLQSLYCLILIYAPKGVLIYTLYFFVSSSSLPWILLNVSLFVPPSQRAMQLLGTQATGLKWQERSHGGPRVPVAPFL